MENFDEREVENAEFSHGRSEAKRQYKLCIMRQWPRCILTDFIRIYRDHPCLWKFDHKDYKNRQLKSEGIRALLRKMRDFDPEATEDHVKLKINTLRTSFRREFRKIQQARMEGDFYNTSLWYYNLLVFLKCNEDYLDKEELEEAENEFDELDKEIKNNLYYTREWPREILIDFINLYKEHTCLWKCDSKNYSNRSLKHRSYLALLKKVRENDPDATIDSVKLKINSLRTCYRREFIKQKKIQEETGELYMPTLWYYDHLSFLATIQDHRNAEKLNDNNLEKVEVHDIEYSDHEVYLPEDPIGQIENYIQPLEEARPINSLSAHLHSSSKRKKFADKFVQTRQLPSLFIEDLKKAQPEDPFDIYGKHIANKLRSVNRLQNMFAQKLINEVLFNGEMRILNGSAQLESTD